MGVAVSGLASITKGVSELESSLKSFISAVAELGAYPFHFIQMEVAKRNLPVPVNVTRKNIIIVGGSEMAANLSRVFMLQGASSVTVLAEAGSTLVPQPADRFTIRTIDFSLDSFNGFFSEAKAKSGGEVMIVHADLVDWGSPESIGDQALRGNFVLPWIVYKAARANVKVGLQLLIGKASTLRLDEGLAPAFFLMSASTQVEYNKLANGNLVVRVLAAHSVNGHALYSDF